MLNQVVIVGRLTKDIEVNETESGKQVSTITLAVPRSFKNVDGGYDTDFFRCILWDQVAINTSTFCHKGDILGVRGRLQSRVIEEKEEKRTVIEIIAEKVTFLSSKKEEKED